MKGTIGGAAVVSGAGGGGIGTAVATSMINSGLELFSIERTAASRDFLLANTNVRPGNVFVGDVGREDDVKNFASLVADASVGPVALVHNAARGASPKAISDTLLSEFQQDLGDILVGGFLLAKYFSDLLIRNAPASIVFVSSIAAMRGARGRGLSYSAAKAGLHGLTVSLALELASHAVNVNAVAPGQTITPRILKGGRRKEKDVRRAAAMHIPLQRPAEPADIASVICFLCSSGARYITGKVIEVDGGQALAPVWTESAESPPPHS